MSRRIACLVAALVGTATLAPGPVLPAAAAADDPAEPLQVSVDSITPGVVPTSGPITIRGEVTNLDEETWTTVNLYSFVSSSPMTTADELAAAIELPEDASVGERIVEPDASDTIEEIAPGDTVQFSFDVPRRLLPISEPGVYWFGVHALGQGPDGRDETADGRARTFLPLVGRRTTPLPVSVVVPLRRQIMYAADGSLSDIEGWTDVLSPGGRLSSLVDLGLAGGSRAVTYLVDPALVTAVQQLAAGNPPRSIEATRGPGTGGQGDGQGDDQGDGQDGEASASADASVAPDGQDAQDGSATGEDGDDGARVDPALLEAQDVATDWLERLGRAVAGHEVLGLPYGDLDVAAAAEHDPAAYAAARARTGSTLAPYDAALTPVVASPGGYLDRAGLDLTDPADTVLISDAMFAKAEGSVPTVATEDGRRIVVTSRASTTGPGPGEARTALSLRQETLAQAAVRAIGDDPQPLVVLLPNDWNPASASGFFSGLDADWVDLVPVGDVAARSAREIRLEDLDYPRSQQRAQLTAQSFTDAQDLTAAGTSLQRLLTRNDTVATTVAGQALTTLGYTVRARPEASRASARASTQWVRDQLGRVSVEAPRAVTMTGDSGRFFATVSNEIDQPVTVGLKAIVGEGIEISRPRRIRVPRASADAPGRTRVLLTAQAPSSGVHRITIRLTDTDGMPLGDSDALTVRSLQVGNVIWVFLAAAGALLLGAIAFRLGKRIRAARRPRAAA